jgi:hypothetical protein
MAFICIWYFIVSDVIDIELLHESFVYHPRSLWDDFIYPSTVPDRFEPITMVSVSFTPTMEARAEPFSMYHYTLSFVRSNLFIRVDANKKIN